MKIFFDLDGTILDASDRLYQLFCDLVPECKFSKKGYWDLKRNKNNHQIILGKYYPKYNFEQFNSKWLSKIEEKDYLKFDKLYPFSEALLHGIKQEMYLLTARQSRENLMFELRNFGIISYFRKIYVTENKATKEDILKRLEITTDDIFISDMGKDIIVANKMGMKSIAVTWGFMSKDNLIKYKPTKCIDTPEQLFEILK